MDPIGIAGGANVYGFAGGDPVNFGDPFGLKPCRVTGSWGSATVDESVAADLLFAMNRANSGGYRGRINSSYRSSARQHELFEDKQTKADSGRSAHEAGTATDTDWKSVTTEVQRETLKSAMNANGYAQTYEGLHHFEHSSTRDNRANRTSLIAANGSYSDTIRDCFLPTVVITATRR